MYVCILLSCTNLKGFVMMLYRLGPYSTCSAASIIPADLIAQSLLTGECSVLMTLAGSLTGFLFSRFFFGKSKTFAQEVRAAVPLPKGTEVHITYKEGIYGDRAARRQVLEKECGFVCKCELCSLPDVLSSALDMKINLVNEADAFMYNLMDGPRKEDWGTFRRISGPRPKERDVMRATQLLDLRMTIAIQERLFAHDYSQFSVPIKLLTFFGQPTLVERVGQATLRVLRRHLGTSISGGDTGVKQMSGYIQLAASAADAVAQAKPDAYLSAGPDHPVNVQLEKTASSIISNLQSLL
jgi:hypothetical protein